MAVTTHKLPPCEADAHANGLLLADIDRRLASGEEVSPDKPARKVSFQMGVSGLSEQEGIDLASLDPQATVAKLPGVLKVHELIGMGSFSYVFSCTVEDSPQECGDQQGHPEEATEPPKPEARKRRPCLSLARKMVAVKLLKGTSLENNREAQLLTELRHPSLVGLLRIVKGPPHAMFLEHCAGGLLHELVHKSDSWWGSLALRSRLRPGLDVTRAVEYLHGQDVVHRDVKTANCFLEVPAQLSSAQEPPHVKLGDLGLARPAADTMTRGIGTVCCMAPEVIKSGHYGTPADVFSSAILLHELATGNEPYKEADSNLSKLAVLIVQGKRPPLECLPECPERHMYCQILEEAWCDDPALRLPASELVARLGSLLDGA